MRVLVTGRVGSGKTTVSKELNRRGYTAFDSDDVPGLSAWTDSNGNKKHFADNSYIDLSEYDWLWDKHVLQNLIKQHEDIFICGGAHNDLSFDDLFDAHFVLDVEPTVQIQRILNREDNDYAKDPRMHQQVIDNQREHLAKAVKMGHKVVDANKPISEVVDYMLRQLQ